MSVVKSLQLPLTKGSQGLHLLGDCCEQLGWILIKYIRCADRNEACEGAEKPVGLNCVLHIRCAHDSCISSLAAISRVNCLKNDPDFSV